jgi:hypothetical protein
MGREVTVGNPYARLLAALAGLMVAIWILVALAPVAGLGITWARVDRVTLDDSDTRPDGGENTTVTQASADAHASPVPIAVLLVGSDSRQGLDDRSGFGEFPGTRADVIVLTLHGAGESR